MTGGHFITGGGGYGSAATAIGGGGAGGGGGGGGGTGAARYYPKPQYVLGDGGTGGATGGSRGKGTKTEKSGTVGGAGGSGGGVGSAGGDGYLYKASTATITGSERTATEAETYSAVQYEINIGDTEGGSSVEPVIMTYGATAVPQIQVPTRTGFTLEGLYSATDSAATKYFDAEGNPDLAMLQRDEVIDASGYWINSGDFTLYPKWEAQEYTLMFNAAGGSGGASRAVRYGALLSTVNITTPSKVGYKFDGYYAEKNGSGTKYMDEHGAWLCNIDGTGTSDGAKYNKTESVTIYANWEPIEYAIQLYSDGEYVEYEDADTIGTVERDEAGAMVGKGVHYGNFTLPSAEEIGLKKEHYNFLGWNIYDEQDWAMYKAGTVYRGGLTTMDGQVANQVYTGRDIVISANGITSAKIGNKKQSQNLVLGTDFEIVPNSYVKNVNVGKASFIIKGIGNYDGYKLVTFKITKKDLKWWQRK